MHKHIFSETMFGHRLNADNLIATSSTPAISYGCQPQSVFDGVKETGDSGNVFCAKNDLEEKWMKVDMGQTFDVVKV